MRRMVILVVAGLGLVAPPAATAARIVGTAKADLLHGTARPDRVAARGGNDRIEVVGGGRDTVSCGGGRDVVAADPADRPARDCELVSRRVSTDPFRNPAAQHASQAEPDNFAWGSTVVSTFQVARFQDGGAENIGFATSRDAGRTWRRGFLPSLTSVSRPTGRFDRASDPVVAYDALHGTWLIASLAFSSDSSALLVSRSPDGISWSVPAVAIETENGPFGIQLDKEWIVCDNGALSPFRGHCYLSYSDIEGFRLVTQTSTDGGATWSAPVGSPDNAGRRGVQSEGAPGPQPLVLPDGTVVIPYFDGVQMSAVRSTDGGATFSPTILIAPISFSSQQGLRAPPLPSAEIGADGVITLAWPDCGPRGDCSAGNDIVISQTRDGLFWSPLTRIPLGPGNHVLPGIAADPARPGRLALVYYTAGISSLKVGFTSSTDGGVTWRAPVRLSPEPMPFSWIARAGGVMVGDYMSTAFAGIRAVPIFVLAQRPVGGRLRQAAFATSIAVP